MYVGLVLVKRKLLIAQLLKVVEIFFLASVSHPLAALGPYEITAKKKVTNKRKEPEKSTFRLWKIN